MGTQDMALLGKYVQERREELGLSQHDIARNGGPSTTTLSKIENGEAKTIRHRTAIDLDRALGWQIGSTEGLLFAQEPPRVAKTPVGTSSRPNYDAPLPDYRDVDETGRGAESAAVWMETDERGHPVMVGRSNAIDANQKPFMVEVRLWPTEDMGAYLLDFMPALTAALNAIRENVTIVRTPQPLGANADAGLSVVEEPYAADEGDRYPGVPGDEDEEMEREP